MILRSLQWQLTTLESMCDIIHVVNGEAFVCENQFISAFQATVHRLSDFGEQLWMYEQTLWSNVM